MAADKASRMAYWRSVLLWMLVIFIVSSAPASYVPKISILHFDKIVHSSEFFILGLLLTRALAYSYSEVNLAKLIIFAIIVASFYAAFDEWHQRFIPGRHPDILDFLFDFIGLKIGAILYIAIRRKRAVNKTV